ncbi:hypothetical protein BX666DRAFT_2030739 [Dichotomocladium elegans]|nr:hypothetical protein BX666DRAFT_2030739 [Dichotomocladium elegans]
MAFAQQQRRQRRFQHSSPLLRYDSEKEEDESTIATSNLILSPRLPPPPASASDSDNDWHIISSAVASSSPSSSSLRVNTRRDSASTHFDPSEPESLASFRPSDTESFSDLDTQMSTGRQEFSNLPAHDGTGTFMDDDPGLSSDVSQEEAGSSPSSFARAMHRIIRAREADFEPECDSMPNILLPHGGITIPSFAVTPPEQQQQQDESHRPSRSMSSTPSFRPTVAGGEVDSLHFVDEDTGGTQTTTSLSGEVKFTRRRRRNLDSIPSHHPAMPGTAASSAVLSAIWDQVRRITTNLLENDANTCDTFYSLASEAGFEGCLPFGSHLHMELGALHTCLEQS